MSNPPLPVFPPPPVGTKTKKNVYDYITKLFRQQAEAIQNFENEHVRGQTQNMKLTTAQVT
jgi:hypothetical protein